MFIKKRVFAGCLFCMLFALSCCVEDTNDIKTEYYGV